jgi:hypothetical protein
MCDEDEDDDDDDDDNDDGSFNQFERPAPKRTLEFRLMQPREGRVCGGAVYDQAAPD